MGLKRLKHGKKMKITRAIVAKEFSFFYSSIACARASANPILLNKHLTSF
jgi:hypothetical protein